MASRMESTGEGLANFTFYPVPLKVSPRIIMVIILHNVQTTVLIIYPSVHKISYRYCARSTGRNCEGSDL